MKYLQENWIGLATLFSDILIVIILLAEYYFDKNLIQRRKVKKVLSKKKKTVIIDIESGNAVVKYRPKDIDVVINTKSN